jgi:hypothetical protein
MGEDTAKDLVDDLARAGKVYSRFPVEQDLELRVLRTAVPGAEFILLADYIPSEDRKGRASWSVVLTSGSWFGS